MQILSFTMAKQMLRDALDGKGPVGSGKTYVDGATNGKIPCCRWLIEVAGVGLREAKDAVDAMWDGWRMDAAAATAQYTQRMAALDGMIETLEVPLMATEAVYPILDAIDEAKRRITNDHYETMGQIYEHTEKGER